jgi:hypothetical protein
VSSSFSASSLPILPHSPTSRRGELRWRSPVGIVMGVVTSLAVIKSHLILRNFVPERSIQFVADILAAGRILVLLVVLKSVYFRAIVGGFSQSSFHAGSSILIETSCVVQGLCIDFFFHVLLPTDRILV